jgi:hypothetical protein
MGCSPSIRGSRESGDQDEHPARVPMDFPRVRPDAPHVRPDRRRADRAGAPPHRGGRRSVVRVRGAPRRASLEERANPSRLVDGTTLLEERERALKQLARARAVVRSLSQPGLRDQTAPELVVRPICSKMRTADSRSAAPAAGSSRARAVPAGRSGWGENSSSVNWASIPPLCSGRGRTLACVSPCPALCPRPSKPA